MVPFGGWEMPLEYPSGTIAEHLACRRDAVVFDVSHLGSVRVEGADAFDNLQRQLTNDLGKISPGRAQYTHLLDPDDASVLDDIIVWWHPDDDSPSRFDVMPNASNTDRVVAAVGGRETTHERAVLAVQGPRRQGPLGGVLAGGRRRRQVPSRSRRVERRRLHGGRHGLHGRAGCRDRRAGRVRHGTVGSAHRRRRPARWARSA